MSSSPAPSQKPLVSVIVPVYNAEQWLRECLRSIAAQSWGELEVVVADDGSTDGSAALAALAAEADPRIRVLSLSHGGQGAARNAALDAARGEWAVMVDADDAIAPRMVEFLMQRALAGPEVDAVRARVSRFHGSLAAAMAALPAEAPAFTTLSGEEAALGILHQEHPDSAHAGAMAVRTSLLRRYPFPEGMIYEDLDLMPRLMAAARRVALTGQPLYCYRVRPGSTLTHFDLRHADALRATEHLCRWAAKERPALLRAARCRRFAAAFNLYGRLCLHGEQASPLAAECWGVICRERLAALHRRSRPRDWGGVMASFLGPSFTALVCKKFF